MKHLLLFESFSETPDFNKYVSKHTVSDDWVNTSYGIGDYDDEDYVGLGTFSVHKSQPSTLFPIFPNPGKIWQISGYAIWNEWSKKSLGVEFFMHNLRILKNIGIKELYSSNAGRSPRADRLWSNLKLRDDVSVEEVVLNGKNFLKVKLL